MKEDTRAAEEPKPVLCVSSNVVGNLVKRVLEENVGCVGVETVKAGAE